ncbi:MAG TPA: ABC transporter permease [Bacteroidales bacterium]|nr:ABC transporter permease [Bacteroidales bacterium]
MNRLFTSIRKEVIILIRDLGGLALIFVMPVILIFVMAMIQDTTFRKLDETRLSVLFINEDLDSVGFAIEEGLNKSSLIELEDAYKGQVLDRELLIKLVSEGKYQIGIIIPSGTSDKVRAKASYLVALALEDEIPPRPDSLKDHSPVLLFFDPAIKHSFRETTRMALSKLTYGIESKMIFDIFSMEVSALLDSETELAYDPEGIITLEERNAVNRFTEVMPNSVQHNVPAWAVFAIFFILIPLSANIIKERNSGSMLRIRLMPGSYWVTIMAKILVYLIISIIQFILMLMVGMFILPLFGLPVLELGRHIPALLLMVIATGLAATSYGMALGAIASTPEQAASFGSVSVIIMAAIGGIWVPVFMMPSPMQRFSVISPLNWGLEGFYTIFLRNGGMLDIFPQALLLFALSGLFMLVAFYFLRLKKN